MASCGRRLGCGHDRWRARLTCQRVYLNRPGVGGGHDSTRTPVLHPQREQCVRHVGIVEFGLGGPEITGARRVVGGRGDPDTVLVQHSQDRLDPKHLRVLLDVDRSLPESADRTHAGREKRRRGLQDLVRPLQLGILPAEPHHLDIDRFPARSRGGSLALVPADPVPQRRRIDPQQLADLLTGLTLRHPTLGEPVDLDRSRFGGHWASFLWVPDRAGASLWDQRVVVLLRSTKPTR